MVSGTDTGSSTGMATGGGETIGVVDTGMMETSDGSTTGGECATDGLDPVCEGIDPDRPYCVQGQCLGCAGEAVGFCLGVDPANPVCDDATSRCVQCSSANQSACQGNTPTCDDGACVACTEHSQCQLSGACHLDPADPLAGACFGLGDVIYVDGSAICPGTGTVTAPFCSLALTVDGFADGSNHVIRLAGGAYTEQVQVTNGKVVLIQGTGAPSITWAAAGASTLSAGQGSFLYMQGIRVIDNPSLHGVFCSGSTVWVDDSEIRGNNGRAIHGATTCNITVRRTGIFDNNAGGIWVLSGGLNLENSAVALNGVPALALSAAIVASFSNVDILYSTIAGNEAASGAANLSCTSATGEVRNSIVVGQTGDNIELGCSALAFEHNATNAIGFGAGTNVTTGPYDPGWFANPGGGDMRLQSPAFTPFGDVALWLEGDPEADADGTVRPMGGAPGFCGVDEP